MYRDASTAKELYSCMLQDRDGETYEVYIDDAWIKSLREYNYGRKIVSEPIPLGKLWPAGVMVEGSGGRAGNCYYTGSYLVYSPGPLTEEDWAILRAQDCFMSGQTTGQVQGPPEILPDGRYCYRAYSECDSSD